MAYRPHIADATTILSGEEIIGLMPVSFVFITKLIGIPQALNVIDAYGGTELFIPNKHALGINHEIAHIIGLNKLQLLANQLGNTYIEIPMGTPITIAMRNRLIRENVKKESKSQLARRYNLTKRQIRTIVNREEKLKVRVDQNLDLFE
ncbi:transcriptional regulator [Acinetobacter pittii]|uniref:Mor transcription activator family protein n=1 Tax=Acinetobacter pittii TaxID=48296 RepID=UPI0013739EA4|nr:Mor transcription activator family protein [Acinetobacter pittii]MBQ5174110.1 transcriptional regulator [Acinetobacter pittii]QHQ32097.1 transcriptional regulator [Acinetobacter pittii]USQ61767.1 transcriptional regulator [Acinetobacter pittii]UTD34390.1 transcriptional regulator [Acinetobacter pittii]